MAVTHWYRLFGLRVASELRLPLLSAEPGRADVTIRRGHVAEEGALVIPEVARFAVRGGSGIVVDASEDVPESNVRLYLLGSAMGMLLHQRGMLPLHANAVEVDGAAIAVMGGSGAGKSTLAAWLHDRGHRLISDDVCVIGGEGELRAFAGVPRLRLWGAALDAFGRSRAGLERAYAGDDEWDKWDLPVADDAVAGEGLKVRALYVLADGSAVRISSLTGAAAAEAVIANTYRGEFVEQGKAAAHWAACLRLIGKVPVFRIERPWDLTRLDALGSALLDHARSAAGARTAAVVP